MLLAVVSTPTSSPSPAQQVVEAAPWWGVPLVAGIFVIAGALLAFTSTYFSDRRKFKREDQRQWDKEIRDLYVRAAKAVEQVRETRHMGDQLVPRRYQQASDAASELATVNDHLILIAQEKTVEAAQRLQYSAAAIAASLHDQIVPKKSVYLDLVEAHRLFLHAVKINLRINPSVPARGTTRRSA